MPEIPPSLTRDLVVIGASAGGVGALRAIVSQLPPRFPAAVLVVLHTGPYPSRLAQVLDAVGPNPARMAADGDRAKPGLILTAPADHHLLIRDGAVQLTRGAREHHTRPAIDPLFRSAALWGGPRVIGVLLSGRNDDGTAGLQAIKWCGGLAVVQDPDDAEEPVMPRSAVDHVRVDHCVPLARIAPLLVELAATRAPSDPEPPDALVREHRVSLGSDDPVGDLDSVGRTTPLTCPDCGGALFELDGVKPQRWRCHTGHAFTLRSLEQAQLEATDFALWAAMRSLNERIQLLRRIAEVDRQAQDDEHADRSEAEADRLAAHVQALRRLVDRAQDAPPALPSAGAQQAGQSQSDREAGIDAREA
jgi:two-component system chemotaxis response regulator CheB